ncbi:hypothetical protein EII34_14045 [Arachnia propionica]|uniref:VWA domain-containing protein n=1 Tax=Arachnia propionica TaxID=1750 RepID=A0A3P1T3K6_9ACTN|nr:hypothetical protein [Arachnia propionica]RRD03406.1 hypothetical protein EII34_14045 [Arachnia propionica]
MRTADEVARDDLLTFLNAAFVSTGQAEFSSTADEQRLGLGFLHEYVRGNYRRLYARLLALGVNDHNLAEIIHGLLSTGGETPPDFQQEENALIRAGVRRLPPQRFWKLTARLRRDGVNNRRTRAVIRDWLARHPDPVFQAVKYRRKVAGALRHIHLHPTGEMPDFLFGDHRRPFATELFETYRGARHSQQAVTRLPYSVARGLAAKHGMDPDKLVERMKDRLTEKERLRAAGHNSSVELRPERLSLTELTSWLLSREEFGEQEQQWLERSARAVLERSGPLALSGRVAAVLDNSFSATSSRQRRGRPLAVAFAADQLLRLGHSDYRGFWTSPQEGLPRPRGQSNLSERLLDALEWGATTVLVISDGIENDPAGAFQHITKRLPSGVQVLHLNPVFDPEELEVANLTAHSRAIGLHRAEDLPTALGFARYVIGEGSLIELETYLAKRVHHFIRGGSDA